MTDARVGVVNTSTTGRSRRVKVVVDWLGVRVPRDEYCHVSYARQRTAHAIRAHLCDLLKWATEASVFPLPLPLPAAAEEYFEYVDVLEAVVAYVREQGRAGVHSAAGGGVTSRGTSTKRATSRRPFVMLEIGAGFGYWTLTAHAALRHLWPEFGRYDFALVEIDHAKQQTLRDALRLNGIADHKATVHHAALGMRDEENAAVQNGHPGFCASALCGLEL